MKSAQVLNGRPALTRPVPGADKWQCVCCRSIFMPSTLHQYMPISVLYAAVPELLTVSLWCLVAPRLSHRALAMASLLHAVCYKGALLMFVEVDAACMASFFILLIRFTVRWLIKWSNVSCSFSQE